MFTSRRSMQHAQFNSSFFSKKNCNKPCPLTNILMCISALVSNSRNGNSAGQPGEELVGCASAVEAEAVFVQVTLEQRTSTMESSDQEYLQIA